MLACTSTPFTRPDVLEAAVVGTRTDDGLETAVAFPVPRSGSEIDLADIDRHCRARMAAFKRPRRVIVVDALPKTATGKVQRFALRRQLDAERSAPLTSLDHSPYVVGRDDGNGERVVLMSPRTR